MRSVFILDRQKALNRRDWVGTLAPNLVELTSTIQGLSNLKAGDILFAHGVLPDLDAISRLTYERHCFTIVVSGSGFEDDYGLVGDRVYRRRQAVASSGADYSFGRCAQSFIEYLDQAGEPSWKLLEPKPWPETLSGLLVFARGLEIAMAQERDLMVRSWQGISCTERQRVWAEAYREYSRTSGASVNIWNFAGFPRVGQEAELPEFNDWTSGGTLSRKVQALSDALPKPLILPFHSDQRSTLSHTWLKNRLLAQVFNPSERSYLAQSKELPRVLGGIPNRVEDVILFAGSLEDKYSTRNLLKDWPLSLIPQEALQILGELSHREFIARTNIDQSRKQIIGVAERLRSVATDAVSLWDRQVDPQKKEAALSLVAQAAENLRSELDELPNGISLA